MNIKGYLLIKDSGLPVGMKNATTFRRFSEIPSEFLKNNEDLFIRGFDDRTKVTDSPYINRGSKHIFLNSEGIKEAFNKINLELESQDIPEKNRIFLIGRAFRDDNVKFCGQATHSDNKILIDIKIGNRPTGQDWTPDFSFQINIKHGNPDLSNINKDWSKVVSRICSDILKFYDKTCIEFVELKSGTFFYHDLYIH
jgi:hypothetical protein